MLPCFPVPHVFQKVIYILHRSYNTLLRVTKGNRVTDRLKIKLPFRYLATLLSFLLK